MTPMHAVAGGERVCPKCERGISSRHPEWCTPEMRFWRRVKKGDGCWEWTAGTKNSGYGVFTPERHGKCWMPHRYSWTIHFGEIPHGMLVCHKCDNKLCVRPDHLFLGSPTDNMRDMAVKGRAKWGEYNRVRTHCKRGHPFSGKNLRIDGKGRRVCRACKLETARNRYRRQREARAA